QTEAQSKPVDVFDFDTLLSDAMGSVADEEEEEEKEEKAVSAAGKPFSDETPGSREGKQEPEVVQETESKGEAKDKPKIDEQKVENEAPILKAQQKQETASEQKEAEKAKQPQEAVAAPAEKPKEPESKPEAKVEPVCPQLQPLEQLIAKVEDMV